MALFPQKIDFSAIFVYLCGTSLTFCMFLGQFETGRRILGLFEKWLGRAVSPVVAHSPGQRPGWTVVHWLKCRALQEQPALWGATPRGIAGYALVARGIFAITKMPIVLIAEYAVPRAMPWAMGYLWAYSPPQSCDGTPFLPQGFPYTFWSI